MSQTLHTYSSHLWSFTSNLIFNFLLNYSLHCSHLSSPAVHPGNRPKFCHNCTSLKCLLEFPALTSIWRVLAECWRLKLLHVTILVTSSLCLFGDKARCSTAEKVQKRSLNQYRRKCSIIGMNRNKAQHMPKHNIAKKINNSKHRKMQPENCSKRGLKFAA